MRCRYAGVFRKWTGGVLVIRGVALPSTPDGYDNVNVHAVLLAMQVSLDRQKGAKVKCPLWLLKSNARSHSLSRAS